MTRFLALARAVPHSLQYLIGGVVALGLAFLAMLPFM